MTPTNPIADMFSTVLVVLTIFVGAPLAIGYAYKTYFRGGRGDDRLARDTADRLARLEAAVDAIAVEVERISEGQRFVTKLLAEARGAEPARLEPPRTPPDGQLE